MPRFFVISVDEKMGDFPRFGRQQLQLLPDGGLLVLSTLETVMAKENEGRDEFLRRLRDLGVGAEDIVELIYKAGKVQYAVIHWSGKRDSFGH